VLKIGYASILMYSSVTLHSEFTLFIPLKDVNNLNLSLALEEIVPLQVRIMRIGAAFAVLDQLRTIPLVFLSHLTTTTHASHLETIQDGTKTREMLPLLQE
jgi:hypothetical protein